MDVRIKLIVGLYMPKQIVISAGEARYLSALFFKTNLKDKVFLSYTYINFKLGHGFFVFLDLRRIIAYIVTSMFVPA